jgi:predicted nucleic acid-binding Zn finger protein
MSSIESGLGMEQERRVVRALVEMSDWEWAWTGECWIVTTATGCYRVWRNSCTCKDHKFVCCGREISCKHVVSLRLRMLQGMTREIAIAKAPQAPLATRSGLPLMTDEELTRFDALFA